MVIFLIMKKGGFGTRHLIIASKIETLGENMSKTKRNGCNILGLSVAFEDYHLEETTTIGIDAKKCNFYKALSS